MGKTEENYISTPKAAKLLGVDRKTIRVWVRKGRLKARTKRVRASGAVVLEVSRTSLKTAFLAKCIWCGKLFRALYPGRALYCCLKHKTLHFYYNVNKPALRKKRRR